MNNKEKFKHIKCNLCGKDNTKLLKVEDDLRIVKCKNCGLVYINPQPTVEYLNEFYSRDDSYTEKWLTRKRRYHWVTEAMIPREIVKIEKLFKGRKIKVLDIGCGPGIFLKAVKDKGWAGIGTELSDPSIELAGKRGVKVLKGDFAKMNFKESKFDLVTMLAVLEHLQDPKLYLKKIHNVLKEDGIVIIKIPNVNYILRKSYNFSMKDLMHLFHFSTTTIRELLEKCGFEVIEIVPVVDCGSDNFFKNLAMLWTNGFLTILYKLFGVNRDLQMIAYARRA